MTNKTPKHIWTSEVKLIIKHIKIQLDTMYSEDEIIKARN